MTVAAIIASAVLAAGTHAQAVDHAAQCRQEAQGMKILVSATIKVHRNALSDKLNALDFREFCGCYHTMLRTNLGKDLYERSRTLNAIPALPDADVMRVSEQDDRAIVSCVEAQLSRPGVASNGQQYDRFIQSTLVPDAGVGGLRLRDTREAMFRALGRSRTFRVTADGGEEYYYGPYSTEVVISLSPARQVRQITLSHQFRGQTPGGARIGDSRARVKQTFPGRLATELPGFLVYCDGTTFVFRNDRLNSIRLAELTADVFEKDRRAACAERR